MKNQKKNIKYKRLIIRSNERLYSLFSLLYSENTRKIKKLQTISKQNVKKVRNFAKTNEIKLKEVEYPKYDRGIIPVSYSHFPSLLGRLALMYNEIGDEEYMKKCILEMKRHGLSREDIQEHVDNQKQNKSFIWFKNEYLPYNKDKLKNNIAQDK